MHPYFWIPVCYSALVSKKCTVIGLGMMSVRWFVGREILPIQKCLPVTRLEHGAAARRFITSLKSRPWQKIPPRGRWSWIRTTEGDSFFTQGIWPKGIIFHPARFPWNFRDFPLLNHHFGVEKLVWGRCNLTSKGLEFSYLVWLTSLTSNRTCAVKKVVPVSTMASTKHERIKHVWKDTRVDRLNVLKKDAKMREHAWENVTKNSKLRSQVFEKQKFVAMTSLHLL